MFYLVLLISAHILILSFRKIKGRKKTDLASKYGVESNGQTQMDTVKYCDVLICYPANTMFDSCGSLDTVGAVR